MGKRKRGRKRATVAKKIKQAPPAKPAPKKIINNPPVETPKPERKVTVEIFYQHCVRDIIVSALKKNREEQSPGAELCSDETILKDLIKEDDLMKVLMLITKDCMEVLHQIIENGSRYSSTRKIVTIEDFNKGLNYYNW